MKVLFINTVYGRGSTGKLVQQLGDAVVSQGGCFKVCYGRGEYVNSSGYRIGSNIDLYTHAILTRITDKCGFYSKRATYKLIKEIEIFQPDIIHMHNLHGYYINIEILFNYLKTEFKGKIFWTIHDCWSYTGHCVHYTTIGCYKWMTKCGQCPQKNIYPASCFIDNSTENFTKKKAIFTGVKNMTLIPVSDWLKSELEKSFLSEYTIERIYNGIDLSVYFNSKQKDRNKLSKEKNILLVSDGWNESKGWTKLLDVAQLAPENWTFHVVGVTKNQIKQLPKNIKGYERIWNQKELISMYQQADVFFNPSLQETFGLVTAEAIACGTPALVMNSTACPEVVKVSKAGMIVEKDIPIQDLISVLESTMNISINSNALDAFSLENFKSQHLNLYKK